MKTQHLCAASRMLSKNRSFLYRYHEKVRMQLITSLFWRVIGTGAEVHKAGHGDEAEGAVALVHISTASMREVAIHRVA